jgi:hypothetical protein
MQQFLERGNYGARSEDSVCWLKEAICGRASFVRALKRAVVFYSDKRGGGRWKILF